MHDGIPDPAAVAELALFNVTLGPQRSPGDQPCTAPGGKAGTGEIVRSLLDSVETSTAGMSRIALMLSGGYDSRCLLAALLHLGKDVTAYCWDVPNPRIETGIAEELSAVAGCPFVSLSPLALGSEDLKGFLGDYVRRSEGELAVTRLRTAASVSELGSRGADCIVWGEGELIRPPVRPGEYLSAHAVNLLDGASADGMCRPEGSCFAESLPWQETANRFLHRTEYTAGLSRYARYAAWLRDFSYPHIYGRLARAASGRARVVMPLLSPSFTRDVLDRKGSIARRRSWGRSPLHMSRDRRLYFEIVDALAPRLLDVRTDRGYPLGYDGSPLALFHILWAAAGSGFYRKRSIRGRDEGMRRLLADELSRLLPSPLADSDRASAMLDEPDHWTHGQYFELSKLLAVLRYASEAQNDDG
jgi:hypothetical protein